MITCKNCKHGLLIPKSKEKTGKGIYFCKKLSIWQWGKDLTLYEEDDTCKYAQANETHRD